VLPGVTLPADDAVTSLDSADPVTNSTNRPRTTTGAVNRPGNAAPHVNPVTVAAVTLAAATSTGQSGGPPQVACNAVWIYKTATQPRNASSTQHSAPASATDHRDQAGRGVVATRSAVFLRPSLAPAQAATPLPTRPK
jgi:hypothetical protein